MSIVRSLLMVAAPCPNCDGTGWVLNSERNGAVVCVCCEGLKVVLVKDGI